VQQWCQGWGHVGCGHCNLVAARHVGHVLGASGKGGRSIAVCGHVAGHGQVDGALVIVPGKGKAAVACGIPILGDLVLLLESREEMHGIIAVGVADDKVIHNQGEAHIPGVMLP